MFEWNEYANLVYGQESIVSLQNDSKLESDS